MFIAFSCGAFHLVGLTLWRRKIVDDLGAFLSLVAAESGTGFVGADIGLSDMQSAPISKRCCPHARHQEVDCGRPWLTFNMVVSPVSSAYLLGALHPWSLKYAEFCSRRGTLPVQDGHIGPSIVTMFIKHRVFCGFGDAKTP